jgi:hypothetical protein
MEKGNGKLPFVFLHTDNGKRKFVVVRWFTKKQSKVIRLQTD